jgi:exo-beta-1,3-glucanase (GH17 family)
MAANSTWVAPPVAPKTSTPCSEELKTKTPVYTPYSVSSAAAVVSSSKPVEVYHAPSSSKPVEVYHAPSPKPESSKPAVPVYSAPVPVYSAPAYTPVPVYSAVPVISKPAEAPKPKPSSSKAADKPKPTGSYNTGDRIKTNGDKWAITYTPYAKDGQCKTAGEIKSDVKKISEMGFTTIRSYSTDCGVFESVVPECQKYGLKVIYGIFLEGGGSAGKGPFSSYANAQLDDIKNKAPKDSVAMVIVGNECMFNNNCVATELASYIDYVRKELRGAGFPENVAVTTTEPVGTWEEKGAALCDHIDVFTVQVHPYFTASVTAEMAGDFAAQQLAQAAKVCPGAAAKGTYITEIGWPAGGNSNGVAVASPANQKIALAKIQASVGSQACLFSFQNDDWKHPGELGVEQFFGCAGALGY